MKAKEFNIKKRDPNWRAMQDIRRSGAGGQHKDKKKATKQGQVKHKGKPMDEASDFGEPREILENVLQTLEREVEWPLTDVMDPREVRQLLAPIVKAVNDKMISMEEGWNDQDDWSNMSHREFKRRELEHELGHEDEMANYAVLINNKKWKVFDNKRAAEKAAMTIQQKYGKDTRVVQTMERPS